MNNRFLIIEDDPTSAGLLERILKRYGVTTLLGDGRNAVDFILEQSLSGNGFSALFLDIMLPGVDGQDLLMNLRRMEEIKQLEPTRVIIVSSLSETEAYMRARQYHISAYVIKPVNSRNIEGVLAEAGLI